MGRAGVPSGAVEGEAVKRRALKVTAASIVAFWKSPVGSAFWSGAPWRGGYAPCCMACGYAEDGWQTWNAAKLERAHVVGDAEGGSAEVSNLVLLCATCHRAHPKTRHAEDLFRWMDWRDTYEERCFAEFCDEWQRLGVDPRGWGMLTDAEILEALEQMAPHPVDRGSTGWVSTVTTMVDRYVRAHPSERSEPAQSVGDVVRTLIMAFREKNVRMGGALTHTALEAKRARGEKLGTLPYGYRVDKKGPVTRLSGRPMRLIPDEKEQVVIRLARELHAKGRSLREIGTILLDRGHSPRVGPKWGAQTISRILSAPERHVAT